MKRKWISILCTLCLLMNFFVFSWPISAVTVEDTVGKGADVSVMTFNILARNSGSARYDTQANRLIRITKIIGQYLPDVVAFQEAAQMVYVDADSTISWHDALIDSLAPLGYACTSYSDESGEQGTVQTGLMIFYKTARFAFDTEKQDHGWGSLDVTAIYNGVSATCPYNRSYHYMEVLDKEHGNQSVWLFNTHFGLQPSVDVNGDALGSADAAMLIKALRTKQAELLATAAKEKAENAPLFVMGDFNTSLSNAYTSGSGYTTAQDEGYNQLAAIPAIFPAMKPGITLSPRLLNTNKYSAIDHIFVNSEFQTVLDYQTLTENIDGRRPSDHYPVLMKCAYRPEVSSFSAGDYDKWEGTYEHVVDSATFTLTLTPANSNITYSLADNVVGNNTLTLNRYRNNFDIKLYNSGVLYDTVPATIYNTAATRPVLTAENAENVYFANHAYQVTVAEATASVTLGCTGGSIFINETCTVATAATIAPTGGRTTYYIKSAAGEIFPLHIYKETDSTAEGTVYVDDDTLGATGTVAFFNGTDVILGAAGEVVFGDYPEIITFLNDGSAQVAVFAGGNYTGSTTKITESVTLLGNNAQIAADIVDKEGNWSPNTDRKEESVINGGLVYAFTTDQDIATITVKGFRFEGCSKNGAIDSQDTRTDITQVTQLDVQNNIFAGYHTYTFGAPLTANNAVQKTGVVRGNRFVASATLINNENSANDANAMYNRRAIFFRNINELLIEQCSFSGYEVLFYMTSETKSGATNYGYDSYTVKDCHIEYSGYIANWVKNIGATDTASASNIRYENTTFLQCGMQGNHIVKTQYYTSGAGVDLSNCSLEIVGCDFVDCVRSVYVLGSGANAESFILKVNENRFLPNDQHGQLDYLKYALDLNITTDVTPENWDLSYNYFASDYLQEGSEAKETNNNYITPDVHSPTFFINDQKSVVTEEMYTPYYLNYAMTEATTSTPSVGNDQYIGNFINVDDLKAGYFFDKKLKDITGNTATTVAGAGTVTYTEGYYGYAARASGANYITIGEGEEMKNLTFAGADGTDSFSIALWVKRDYTTTSDIDLYGNKNWQSGKNKGITLALHNNQTNGTVIFCPADGTNRIDNGDHKDVSNKINNTHALSSDWVHTLVIVDRTAQKAYLYENFELIESGDIGEIGSLNSNLPFTLGLSGGVYRNSRMDNTTVLMDDLLIFNKAVSTKEIHALESYYGKAESHNWNTEYTIDVEPTCTTAGSKSIYCADCNVQKVDSVTTIPATGNHTYTVEVAGTRVDATCMATGTVTMKCIGCVATEVKTLAIDKDNHTGNNHIENAKDATCTEPGYTGDTVCECGETVMEGTEIPKSEPTGEAYIGDTAYETLAAALAAVKSGETVTLYADVTVSNLMVNPAITLDLNGKTLTADYMVAFDDSAVIDSAEAGSGKIAVPANRMILSKNNPQLPVYDEENGCYLFTRVKNDRFELGSEGNSPKYSTSPMFKDYVHSLLDTEDKAAASGVEVIIRLTWSDSDGQYRGQQDYIYYHDSVAQVMASYTNTDGAVNYANQFYGIFVGSEIESGVNVSVSTIVRSSAGVEMESAATALFTAE